MIGIVNVLETKDSAHESFSNCFVIIVCIYVCIGDNKELMINDIVCSLNKLVMSETASSLNLQMNCIHVHSVQYCID